MRNNELIKKSKFDFLSFTKINNKDYSEDDSCYLNYYSKIPNFFIRCNLIKKYNINKILIIIFVFIDRNKSIENNSYVIINDIFEFCGYKISKNKPKIFYEIIKTLLFLQESKFIKINKNIDFNKISYSDCIKLKIITQNFDVFNNYTILKYSDFDYISNISKNTNVEITLLVFLYIKSFIIKNNNNYAPASFYGSLDTLSLELGISKNSVYKSIHCLIDSSSNKKPLLIKYNVNGMNNNKLLKNATNIFVLNEKNFELEILHTLNKIKNYIT